MTRQITFGLSDPSPISNTGVYTYLTKYLNRNVLFQTYSIEELIRTIVMEGKVPDVCLVVFPFPNPHDASFIDEIMDRWPGIKIIAILGFKVRYFLSDLFQRGISGCLYWGNIKDSLDNAIKNVIAYNFHFNDEEEIAIFESRNGFTKIDFTPLDNLLFKFCLRPKLLMDKTGLSMEQIRQEERDLGKKIGIEFPSQSVFHPHVQGPDPLGILLEYSVFGSYT